MLARWLDNTIASAVLPSYLAVCEEEVYDKILVIVGSIYQNVKDLRKSYVLRESKILKFVL